MRKIIKIDEEKCTGCGLCVKACHEGAIELIDGKAKLVREDYCDGLGDCLPSCPEGAITFENRQALAYDHDAVEKNKKLKEKSPCACAGTQPKTFAKKDSKSPCCTTAETETCLMQWPVQIKLVSVNSTYFQDSDLLIAADCTAYAYGNFHNKFMKNRITLVGCPKLDDIDYSEKLTEIISANNIKTITVVRMQVPCCGGIELAVKTALKNSRKKIPCNIITISTDGNILKQEDCYE